MLSAIIERFSNPLIFYPILFALISVTYSRATARSPVPEDLPWVGKKSNALFAETLAHFSSFNKVREWLRDGYQKYSKQGRSYIFPDFSGRPEVIIPPSEMSWLLEQPDDVLSVSELHNDILAGPYGFTHPIILKDPFHEHVIHRNLARRIGPLIMDVWDELSCAIDDTWGFDTEHWAEISIFENMMQVIARAQNRIFVGLPLCRNEAYLESMGGFAKDVMNVVILMRFTPKILEPLLGPLFAIPNNIHYRRSAAMHLPLIKERLELMQRKAEDPSFDWQPPNDYLTWHIQQAQAENRPRELEPEMLSRRLMPINFGAIHTTVFAVTNCIFDLAACPPMQASMTSTTPVHPFEAIREEAQEAFHGSGNIWCKQKLARLVRTDSALRESLRVSNFLTRGLQRKVVARNGIENKSQGFKLEHGAIVAMDVHSVMHDPLIYRDPYTFDPFRFSKQREEEEGVNLADVNGGVEAGKAANGHLASNEHVSPGPTVAKSFPNGRSGGHTLESKMLSVSATSETFLPFGHGRHACPGRFLVSHEIKMLLAYITMNYEIEPMDERPPNTWVGQNVIPPAKAKIRVRRRTPSEVAR